ncbi:hypothetical protein Y032_0101g3371 [Ancylostoma ceylanicum]|nr:hypothetical protein Y032_0101g3371 [Ancylostoma ceylanicum]
MCLYLYLIRKLLKWRRNMEQFKSSYYSLFLMQFIADFYLFIFVEVIMRPRKFNYFGLYSENMQGFAVFSTANLLITKGVICCGHVVIALNRFTAFYLPFKQEKIWTKSVVLASILSLWGMFVVASLSVIIIYRDSPKLIRLENGILQMYFGPITTYDSYQCRITYVFTVVVCSICYLSSYHKARKSEQRNAKLEQRLFICAAASSFPFCIEVLRSTLESLSFENKGDLYIWMAEFWYYEMEITATVSVWLQLLINKNVRILILRDILGSEGCPGTSTVTNRVSTY